MPSRTTVDEERRDVTEANGDEPWIPSVRTASSITEQRGAQSRRSRAGPERLDRRSAQRDLVMSRPAGDEPAQPQSTTIPRNATRSRAHELLGPRDLLRRGVDLRAGPEDVKVVGPHPRTAAAMGTAEVTVREVRNDAARGARLAVRPPPTRR